VGISRHRSRRPPSRDRHVAWSRSALRWCAVGPLLLALTACHWAVLDPRGPVGQEDRTILIDSLAIMLAIGIPTIFATFAFAWWFRASNTRARYRPDWEFSGAIELVVWAIPAMVIILLGGVAWIGSHDLDPAKPLSDREAPVDIQVISLDWKWLFIYPQQKVASVNDLVIPSGIPVHFSLTSASVMNSFFVPLLGSIIATMYGMVTQLYLQADRVGDYYGESTQFSGDGFSDMNFMVHAVPASDFAQWIDRARSAGPTLDREAYSALAQESRHVRPFTYRQVDPQVFAALAKRELAPEPGPHAGRGGVDVHPESPH